MFHHKLSQGTLWNFKLLVALWRDVLFAVRLKSCHCLEDCLLVDMDVNKSQFKMFKNRALQKVLWGRKCLLFIGPQEFWWHTLNVNITFVCLWESDKEDKRWNIPVKSKILFASQKRKKCVAYSPHHSCLSCWKKLKENRWTNQLWIDFQFFNMIWFILTSLVEDKSWKNSTFVAKFYLQAQQVIFSANTLYHHSHVDSNEQPVCSPPHTTTTKRLHHYHCLTTANSRHWWPN